jgi:hypothetical protein
MNDLDDKEKSKIKQKKVPKYKDVRFLGKGIIHWARNAALFTFWFCHPRATLFFFTSALSRLCSIPNPLSPFCLVTFQITHNASEKVYLYSQLFYEGRCAHKDREGEHFRAQVYYQSCAQSYHQGYH